MRPSAESPRARGRRREPQRATENARESPEIRKSPRVSEGAWSFLLLGEGVYLSLNYA